MTETNLRYTYDEIKEMALFAYFDFCRTYGVVHGRSHWSVLTQVVNEYDYVFQRKIEELMFHVVLFVLAGNWSPEFSASVKKYIEENLSVLILGDISEIPSEELEEFIHDLEILGLYKRPTDLQPEQGV